MSFTTVQQYLDSLPPGRREAIEAVRQAIVDNLPVGFEEGIQYNMIGYYVPHSVCPDGYHCDPEQPVPFAGIANGKAKMSLHVFGLYVNPEATAAFVEDWKATGKKLDMGKSCVRFKKLEDVPLDVVGRMIGSLPMHDFLDQYEGALSDKMKKKRSGIRNR